MHRDRFIPVGLGKPLPAGRALLTLLTPLANEEALLSESELVEDWLKPSEDEAWAYLQPVRSPLPSYAETAGDG